MHHHPVAGDGANAPRPVPGPALSVATAEQPWGFWLGRGRRLDHGWPRRWRLTGRTRSSGWPCGGCGGGGNNAGLAGIWFVWELAWFAEAALSLLGGTVGNEAHLTQFPAPKPSSAASNCICDYAGNNAEQSWSAKYFARLQVTIKSRDWLKEAQPVIEVISAWHQWCPPATRRKSNQ